MGVIAVLRPGAVTVNPGRDARCQVIVRNTGQVVDQFLLTIVGEVAGWAKLRPESVNLLPNEETLVDLLLAPPMTHEVLAGEHPFAVRVVSREDSEGSLVYEGTVTVTEFVQVNAEIVPHTSRGRWRGRHTLAVDNIGNFPLNVELHPKDKDALLNFRVRPKAVLTEPGTATMFKIRPRPVKTFWRGPERKVPFLVEVVPGAGKSVTVEAVLSQKALLPRRLFLLLALLLLLLFVLVLVITTILQKAPVSMAGPSPAEPSTSATISPSPTATATGGDPSSGPPVIGGSSQSGDGNGSGNSAGDGSDDFTIHANAYPGAAQTPQLFSYVVPSGQALKLISVRFSGQQSDNGTVQIRLDSTVLASFTLKQAQNLVYQFPTPPTVNAGQRVTLAVTCTNEATPCQLEGAFSVG